MTGARRIVVAVLLSLSGAWLSACTATTVADRGPTAPAACVDTAKASRGSVEGSPVWVRFCPGPRGRTAPAEVPSGALTSHLEQLDDVVILDAAEEDARCPRSLGRTYRLQIGYADGRVAQVAGHTDPDCAGRLQGSDTPVAGPEGLGVYGLVMAAYGRQHADGFETTAGEQPLVCPADPRRPDSVDVDGASTSLSTGYHLGERRPMLMPLSAVRGIVCTWPFWAGDRPPDVRELGPQEAERVRIGMHAIAGGMVRCGASDGPTHTAVVEDRTGTRRAVTIIRSRCSTVIRSDGGHGLGFAWLDR